MLGKRLFHNSPSAECLLSGENVLGSLAQRKKETWGTNIEGRENGPTRRYTRTQTMGHVITKGFNVKTANGRELDTPVRSMCDLKRAKTFRFIISHQRVIPLK